MKVMEDRGYIVRRIRGFSQIDVARNCIASDAVREGFLETLWIDSDIGFNPDDVERLRSHQLPIVCGIYPKKGKRQLTCRFLPETTSIRFGAGGGLLEILYAATGFLYVHRDAYLQIQNSLKLHVCNQAFGESVVPWFQPLVRDYRGGHWYLGEDFAFSERARLSGIPVYADTSIRLFHYGTYGFSWEESGSDPQRFESYEMTLHPDENNCPSWSVTS